MNNLDFISDYYHEGHIVLPRVFDLSLCTSIEEAIRTDCKINSDHCVPMPFRESSYLLNLCTSHPTLISTIRYLFNGKTPCLFGGEYFARPPGQDGFPPHYDNQSLRVSPPDDALTVWIALAAVCEDNGGLTIYPRSHMFQHTPVLLEARSSNRPDLPYYGIDKKALVKWSGQQYCPKMEVGDVLVFHSNLVHSSNRN